MPEKIKYPLFGKELVSIQFEFAGDQFKAVVCNKKKNTSKTIVEELIERAREVGHDIDFTTSFDLDNITTRHFPPKQIEVDRERSTKFAKTKKANSNNKRNYVLWLLSVDFIVVGLAIKSGILFELDKYLLAIFIISQIYAIFVLARVLVKRKSN